MKGRYIMIRITKFLRGLAVLLLSLMLTFSAEAAQRVRVERRRNWDKLTFIHDPDNLSCKIAQSVSYGHLLPPDKLVIAVIASLSLAESVSISKTTGLSKLFCAVKCSMFARNSFLSDADRYSKPKSEA